MIEIKAKLRRWGNSFGIVVPQKAIEQTKAKEGDEITVLFKRDKPNLRKLFGAHKFSKPTEQLMKEMDEELYND
ncbi:AbrB/MazE/SpoVT family DNA-binding domain-containing protein [Candidatus Pacearchaeota archaeon]|nr:AbrB/MazE/SpoVT family DNA-binding domain-containing protein [Candidatus Pacearchaeota archaeon]